MTQTLPIYNIKAVSQETGVPPDTLRAWERRYGILHPHRTNGGHRLYSEHEIAIIRWLRDRTAEGLTISQAIALFAKNTIGEHPHIPIPTTKDPEPHTWAYLNRQLLAAFCAFDEARTEQIMSEAFALYLFEDVLEKLLRTTLITIGELWHAGKLTVAVEHFASHVVRRKLLNLLSTYTTGRSQRGTILAGCAPDEQHDLGILLLAVALVRHGWHVVYLGAQVPLPDLLETIHTLRPDIVCLSASTQASAQQLLQIGQVIADLPEPRPIFGFGGQAFNQNPLLGEHLPGKFLGTNMAQTLDTIAKIV